MKSWRAREKVDFTLASPFDLLAARQNEFTAIRDTLTAPGDYWQARMALARASGQPPPDPTGLLTLQLLDDDTFASGHADDAPAQGAHQHDTHHQDMHQHETPPNNGGHGAHR